MMTATKGLGTTGNGAGTVTALDHKMAQLGLFVKTAANTIRTGVLWDGNPTIVSGKANMSYDVRALAAVLSRGSTAGAVLLTNDGTYNVATTAAPGSNSRYDVVYLWQREYSLDGTDSNPVIGVVQGTAAASPTVPSLAAYPGAIELARILVPAGVTATNSGTTITQKAKFTAAAGGVIPFRNTTERDEDTYQEGQLGWLIDSDSLMKYTGSNWDYVAPLTTYALRSATNLSNGSVLQALDFSSPVGSAFTESTGVFTCAIAGTYKITLAVTFAANSTSLRGAGLLYSNGSVTHATIIPAQSSTVPQTITLTWLLTVAVGETVTAQALQVSGGNLATSAEILFERVA